MYKMNLLVSLGLVLCLTFSTTLTALANNVGPEEFDLEYEVVTRLELIKGSQLQTWYEETHRAKGVHTLELDGDTYVLVSAGPKSTGGFSLRLARVSLTEPTRLAIKAELLTPKPGDMVTMAFTYPHLFLRFPKQMFDQVELDLIEPDLPLQGPNPLTHGRM